MIVVVMAVKNCSAKSERVRWFAVRLKTVRVRTLCGEIEKKSFW